VQPLLQWKSNKYYIFWVCVCSLRYPACNAHEPRCYPALQYIYTLFHKRHDFFKAAERKYVCFDFINNFCLKHFSFWEELSEIWSKKCTVLFEMIVGVLTTCHTQYTWDRSMCIFLFNRTYRAPVRYVTKTWSVVLLNIKIHILLSQVYCVWQVVKNPTIISNNLYTSLHAQYALLRIVRF